jgi:hypothetical protein
VGRETKSFFAPTAAALFRGDMLRVRTSSDTQLTAQKARKSQLLKRSLSENVSGEEACGCIQAASMHVAIKLQSHKDAR